MNTIQFLLLLSNIFFCNGIILFVASDRENGERRGEERKRPVNEEQYKTAFNYHL